MLVILDTPDRKEYAAQRLRAVPVEAGFCMEIKEYKSSRSLAQNRRYWDILTDTASQAPALTGDDYFTPDAWHLHFRKRFLGFDVIETPGGVIEMPKSTKKLKIKPFSDYMTQVEVFAVEMGVMLRDGNY